MGGQRWPCLQVRIVHDDIGIMTDIEVLLSVDGGEVPPGTVAFFMRDAEAEKR
jgi:hypothetical protein